MNAEVLHLSFDGMTDPLGRSQVLPYLIGLARRGHRIRILSLEKSEQYQEQCATVNDICGEAGIEWHAVPYRTNPPVLSTLRNLHRLTCLAKALHRKRPVNFIHCRSDLPAIVGLRLKQRYGVRLLYDMRAFWPDERAEGGAWDQSKWLNRTMFRYFKRRQRELLATADEVVILSEEGRRTILDMGARNADQPTTVIACCADFELFVPATEAQRTATRAELGIDADTPLLIHVGSIGCNCLLGEMLDFFGVYRERHPTAQFLFVAPAGEPEILAAGREHGVGDAMHVRSAMREEVARWIGAADLGIMFVRPVWSKKAASPTKLGEILAAGLPVVANAGVGDIAEIVRESGVGMVVDRFDAGAYRAAITGLDGMQLRAEEIRTAGRRWFDLAIGIERYDAIYRRLACRKEP